jgi:hypothetical protein
LFQKREIWIKSNRIVIRIREGSFNLFKDSGLGFGFMRLSSYSGEFPKSGKLPKTFHRIRKTHSNKELLVKRGKHNLIKTFDRRRKTHSNKELLIERGRHILARNFPYRPA